MPMTEATEHALEAYNPGPAPTPTPPPTSRAQLPPPPNAKVNPAEPKGPVPPEHTELVDVLEQLRSECVSVASQPQMKRKLEDVARKLELLSEKLREGSLSPKTLDSLHRMVEALKNKDYHLALSTHTQLVTAGNFAEISTFLPAVKVLIQVAAQLGVYI
jgi:protein transport protein SEC31